MKTRDVTLPLFFEIVVPTITARESSKAVLEPCASMPTSGLRRISLFYPGLLPQVTEQFAILDPIAHLLAHVDSRVPTSLPALPGLLSQVTERLRLLGPNRPTATCRLQGSGEPSCSTLGCCLRLPSDPPLESNRPVFFPSRPDFSANFRKLQTRGGVTSVDPSSLVDSPSLRLGICPKSRGKTTDQKPRARQSS